tara:strand:+ start:68906 stop:69889 length:984 start_codon:yes stop_codon:yes gene_type:complete
MLLIATDEAGYGPKLGPLVVVATAWRLPPAVTSNASQEQLDQLFVGLREPIVCGETKFVVDDSKAVYQSKGKDGIKTLHAVVSAAIHWMNLHSPSANLTRLEPFLRAVASSDYTDITKTAWLSDLSDENFLPPETTLPVVHRWSQSGLQLQHIATKVITARRFNDACHSGMNKADLLSQSTLGLVRHTLESCAKTDDRVDVYCDRHGGRQFYGGVLQHTFDESLIQMIDESKQQSTYRFSHLGREAVIRFTVKGDSFTPVAMSSIIAKYLRERFMQSMNRYFETRHTGDAPLKPTAGYPVDADRFLAEIADILHKQPIAPDDLVRQR